MTEDKVARTACVVAIDVAVVAIIEEVLERKHQKDRADDMLKRQNICPELERQICPDAADDEVDDAER